MASAEAVTLLVTLGLTYWVHACIALDCELNESDPIGKVAYTILVDQNGKGKFTKIQQAVDSIPSRNNKWIRILISPGIYMEKVTIPREKGCIYMEGTRSENVETMIVWGDHADTESSPTFTAQPDNIVLKGLSFKNDYILALERGGPLKPAVAARLIGDKYVVMNCAFYGLQDTLWDGHGRHYFNNCYITGAVDFIWGFGQSIYEKCVIVVNLKEAGKQKGYITAQGRATESDPSGFVFKDSVIKGDNTLLGRAYKAYSRVIFYKCDIQANVEPVGWDIWEQKGREGQITFVEAWNRGEGASTAGRMPWLKQMSDDELKKFTSISYIDYEGWMSRVPPGAYV